MKILFAIQGTGNGHLSRAKDVYPELSRHGQTDVLISGIQTDVDFPFPVKYKLYGLSFIFGKKGGIDFFETFRKLKVFQLISDIKKLPVLDYDLVISDFEPISSWSCRLNDKPCISLSHQCAVLNANVPKPSNKDFIGEFILNNYAPATDKYGFHFHPWDDKIFTPIIRNEIRSVKPINKGHYTVYLPAYDDKQIIKHLSNFPNVAWHVFSKHNKVPFVCDNITVSKIENKAFIASLGTSAGLLCGAGFEGPAEALYLGKKLMVIPMKNQYEQHCNAMGASAMGASAIGKLSQEFYEDIALWIKNTPPANPLVDYPDITREIVNTIIRNHIS